MAIATQRKALTERFGTFSANLALVNAKVIATNAEQLQVGTVAAGNSRIVAAGGERSIRRCCNICNLYGKNAGDNL